MLFSKLYLGLSLCWWCLWRCLSFSESLQETLFGWHPADVFWTFKDFWIQEFFYFRITVSCFSQYKTLNSYFPLWRKVRSGFMCVIIPENCQYFLTLWPLKNKIPPFDSKQKMSRLPVMSNKRVLTSSSSSSENCHDCPPAQVCT